jgi:hypothetical protein
LAFSALWRFVLSQGVTCSWMTPYEKIERARELPQGIVAALRHTSVGCTDVTIMTWKLAVLLLGTWGAASGYDLPADVEARGAEARRELGPKTAVETVDGVFILITPRGARSLSGTSAIARQVLGAYFNGRFEKRPSRAVSVYLFPDAKQYEAYCVRHWESGCVSPFGFYRPDERRIVMNVGPGIGTLTHELVHPIVETDFPQAPEWVNEGIASLFEALSMPSPGQIHGVKNWRHPRLARALGSPKEREKASLPALFGLNDSAFRDDDEALHYATARYLCQWLDQQGLLWGFYRHFREHHSEDPSGALSFRAITGRTPAEANADWVRWVKRL